MSGTIYVVQASIGGPVKIGHTSFETADQRIAQLQMASPFLLTTLHVQPGSEKLERELHDRYEGYRLHGEWFAVEGELLDWLRTAGADPLLSIEPEHAIVSPLKGLSELGQRVLRILAAYGPEKPVVSAQIAHEAGETRGGGLGGAFVGLRARGLINCRAAGTGAGRRAWFLTPRGYVVATSELELAENRMDAEVVAA